MSKKINFIEYEDVLVRKYIEVEISNEDFQLLEQDKISVENIAQKYNDTTDCFHREDLDGYFESYGEWRLQE